MKRKGEEGRRQRGKGRREIGKGQSMAERSRLWRTRAKFQTGMARSNIVSTYPHYHVNDNQQELDDEIAPAEVVRVSVGHGGSRNPFTAVYVGSWTRPSVRQCACAS